MRKTILSFLFLIFIFSAFAETRVYENEDYAYTGTVCTFFDKPNPYIVVICSHEKADGRTYNYSFCYIFENKESAENYYKKNVEDIKTDDLPSFYKVYSSIKNMFTGKDKLDLFVEDGEICLVGYVNHKPD